MDNEIVSSTTNDDIKRFNQWAETYDQSVWQRLYFGPVHSKMLDLIGQELKDPPRCLIDVGCGTGRLLRAAAVRWPEAQLFGVDPAERMVSEAKRFNPNLTFQLAPAESLPFADQTADLVLTSISFHHWANQAKGLQEIARVLRPGGLFCLTDIAMLLPKLFGKKVKIRSRNQIRALITGAGLTVRQHQRLRMRFVLITLAQK